jgi:hypothetical protein
MAAKAVQTAFSSPLCMPLPQMDCPRECSSALTPVWHSKGFKVGCRLQTRKAAVHYSEVTPGKRDLDHKAELF